MALIELVTDNFNRTNENPIAGNWSQLTGTYVQLLSNQVSYTTAGDHAMAYWSARSFSKDQYSQATISQAGNAFGLALRCSGGTGYFIRLYGGNAELCYWTGSTYNLIGSFGAYSPTLNDVVRAEVLGNAFKFYVNGALTGDPIADTSKRSGGSPGVFFYATGNALDDWSGGNVTSDGIAYVNGSGVSNSSGSTTNAPAINAISGNCIVVGVMIYNNSTPWQVLDTAGNIYSKVGSTYTSGLYNLEFWIAKNIVGNAANVVSVSHGWLGGQGRVIVAQFSGVEDSAVPFDGGFIAEGNDASSPWLSSSGTTLVLNEMIVGIFMDTSTGATSGYNGSAIRQFVSPDFTLATILSGVVGSGKDIGITGGTGPFYIKAIALFPYASLTGLICWGHDTDVTEITVANFTGNWSGTGSISGSGDSEKIGLQAGQSMESPAINTGVGKIIISTDFYKQST